MEKQTRIALGIIIVVIIIMVAVMFKTGGSSSKDADTQQESNTSTPIVAEEETTSNDTTPPTNEQPTSGPLLTVGTSATTASIKSFTVDGNNFVFAPKVMEVNKGDTVKITFKNSAGTHDLKIDEFGVATKKLATGEEETIEFVADKTGSFEYYCSIGSHRAMGMWGTLTVK